MIRPNPLPEPYYGSPAQRRVGYVGTVIAVIPGGTLAIGYYDPAALRVLISPTLK